MIIWSLEWQIWMIGWLTKPWLNIHRLITISSDWIDLVLCQSYSLFLVSDWIPDLIYTTIIVLNIHGSHLVHYLIHLYNIIGLNLHSIWLLHCHLYSTLSILYNITLYNITLYYWSIHLIICLNTHRILLWYYDTLLFDTVSMTLTSIW